MSDYKRSWLIQRVERPYLLPSGHPLAALDGAFSFGCVARGGLSKEAFDVLRPLVSWDYMGAAEYEFGAVPKALQAMVQAADLSTWETTVKVRIDWHQEPERKRPAKGQRTFRTATLPLYVLGRQSHRADIDATLQLEADADGRPRTVRDDYRYHLASYAAGGHYKDRFLGGLELDNGWWFFVDREARDRMAHLFGVETKAEVPA